MDHNTLSQYGWLIISLIIVLSMIVTVPLIVEALKQEVAQVDNALLRSDDETPVARGGMRTAIAQGINVQLLESGSANFQLVPGAQYTRSVGVSVLQGTNVDVYIFVKVEPINDAEQYLEYAIDADIWTPVPGVDNVYYCESPAETRATYNVLLNDSVVVKNSLAEGEIPTDGNRPKLKFSARAVPRNDFTDALTAWLSIAEND